MRLGQHGSLKTLAGFGLKYGRYPPSGCVHPVRLGTIIRFQKSRPAGKPTRGLDRLWRWYGT